MTAPSLDKATLVQLIISAVEPNVPADRVTSGVLSEQTILFGPEGLLDSLGLVTSVLDVEQEVNARLGLSIALADEKAMSQKRSPFRSVGTLADYVLSQVGAAK